MWVIENLENLESHGIYNFNFQAWKVMEFNIIKGYEKSLEAICFLTNKQKHALFTL